MGKFVNWIGVAIVAATYAALRILLDASLDAESKWQLATTFNLVVPDASAVFARELLLSSAASPFHRWAAEACAQADSISMSAVVDIATIVAIASLSPRPHIIAAIGLLSPITLLTSTARSCWSVWWLLPALAANLLALRKSPLRDLAVTMLLAPGAVLRHGAVGLFAALCVRRKPGPAIARMLLLGGSAIALSIHHLHSKLGAEANVPPHAGVFWYFAQQLFPQYEVFFVAVFDITPAVVALPLAIKVSHTSRGEQFVLCVAVVLSTVAKHQLALIDLLLAVLMCVAAFGDVVAQMPYMFVIATSTAIAVPLQIAYHTSWIHKQVANANFLFFASATVLLSSVIFATQFIVVFIKMHRKSA